MNALSGLLHAVNILLEAKTKRDLQKEDKNHVEILKLYQRINNLEEQVVELQNICLPKK